MSDTLYIQTDENMEVHHPHVYLQDIVKLSCSCLLYTSDAADE